jgi:hypothetical protein
LPSCQGLAYIFSWTGSGKRCLFAYLHLPYCLGPQACYTNWSFLRKAFHFRLQRKSRIAHITDSDPFLQSWDLLLSLTTARNSALDYSPTSLPTQPLAIFLRPCNTLLTNIYREKISGSLASKAWVWKTLTAHGEANRMVASDKHSSSQVLTLPILLPTARRMGLLVTRQADACWGVRRRPYSQILKMDALPKPKVRYIF